MDKRILKNKSSTKSLIEIIRAIIKNPEDYSNDEILIDAIKSQSGIAKLQYRVAIRGREFHKNSMSLNTLKRYADQFLDEGFVALDKLRLEANQALVRYNSKPQKSHYQSKASLKFKIEELEKELDKHRSINFILLQAVNSSINSINSILAAPNDSVRGKRGKDGIERLRAILSLNPRPFDSNPQSIVNIEDYKNGL
ncbi:hypothetical protein [Marinobacter sp.]|uniref:hypothetical protein n=1 Tax=Marinobacter sp. TaxID=50741 RepID=UPI000C55858C|nr:hypothetical protein [Marinobacter sp.]MBE94706.1 hypothetical protein [Marinobacter sp.]|tara:strand:- start:1807 stop:2397 length:591 start_codon:yes stop_codon:yes gene_type:complete